MRCLRNYKIVAPLFFVYGQTIYHVKANRLNYLNKALVFRYLILPFSFEVSVICFFFREQIIGPPPKPQPGGPGADLRLASTLRAIRHG